MSALFSILYVLFSVLSCFGGFFISLFLLTKASDWHADSGGRPLPRWLLRTLAVLLSITIFLF